MANRPGCRTQESRGRGARAQRGGTLIGMFIGMVLGLALAAGVAYWLSKGGALGPGQPTTAGKDAQKSATRSDAPAERSRFDFYRILPGGEEARVRPPETRPVDQPQDRSKGKGEPAKADAQAEPAKGEAARGEAAKGESVKAGDRTAVAKVEPSKPEREAGKGERFFLQAGAFRTQEDAENQKARLALAGYEASIQPTTAADRSTLYRVRVGPFDNSDEMNRNRAELAKRGFDVSVIRNP
jgi:cell division protein FtsN